MPRIELCLRTIPVTVRTDARLPSPCPRCDQPRGRARAQRVCELELERDAKRGDGNDCAGSDFYRSDDDRADEPRGDPHHPDVR